MKITFEKKVKTPVKVKGPVLFVEVDDCLIDWEASNHDYMHMIPDRNVMTLICSWYNHVGTVVLWSNNQSWADYVAKLFFPDKNILCLDKNVNLDQLEWTTRIFEGDVFLDPYPDRIIADRTIKPAELRWKPGED